MLDHAAGGGRHRLIDRGRDLYSTPACAVEALLTVERLPHCVWEPACGLGGIACPLRDAGHAVICSDIVAYDGFVPHFVADFLSTTKMPAGCEAIVSNPPYALADAFVRHAIKLAPMTCMLLRLAYLEGLRRADIIERSGLAHVHLFANRLPMLHRHGWRGRRASNAIAFAWFTWIAGYSGPTTIDRLTHGGAVG